MQALIPLVAFGSVNDESEVMLKQLNPVKLPTSPDIFCVWIGEHIQIQEFSYPPPCVFFVQALLGPTGQPRMCGIESKPSLALSWPGSHFRLHLWLVTGQLGVPSQASCEVDCKHLFASKDSKASDLGEFPLSASKAGRSWGSKVAGFHGNPTLAEAELRGEEVEKPQIPPLLTHQSVVFREDTLFHLLLDFG